MKLFTTFLLALSGGCVLAAETAKPSLECAGITGTNTKKKETCLEQCEAALKSAKSKTTDAAAAKSDDPKALADAAAALHKTISENMESSCELPLLTTKVKHTPWYKSIWFICLVSIIALLAVLGAIYHFMGHPGMNYSLGDSTATGGVTPGAAILDPSNNVGVIPEDAERLM